MLVLGHVTAATVAAGWADEKADLRWVIFFGLLADLVDKPVGLILFHETLNNGRVYFHSLFVNLVLTLLLVLLRKPLVYSLALWIHQFADLMWTRPWVAMWPLTGSFAYRDLSLDRWVSITLGPYNLTTEAVACLILVWLIRRHRLHEARRLLAWARSGRIDASGEADDTQAREVETSEAKPFVY